MITKHARKIAVGAAAFIIAITTLVGCGAKANEPFKDAPRDGSNNDPALVIEMPDGFSNLATKCVDGVRYTVAFHGDHTYGAVTTVIDPACKGR